MIQSRLQIFGLGVSLALAISACGAGAGAHRDNAVILGAKAAKDMLKQCSRDTPKSGVGKWRPSWVEVDALEAALPAALAKAPDHRIIMTTPGGAQREISTMPRTLDGEIRQYVGLVKGGRRYLYGNFFPGAVKGDRWRRKPVVYCDGGPEFFGVEYDVEDGTITHLAFNGEA